MMTPTPPAARRLLVLLLVGLLPLGCGDDDPSGPPEGGDRADVNAYLRELPEWASFAEVQDTADTPVGEQIADMSETVLCTATPYSITQNPEAIVTFGSAPNVLYLGSLIQGETYLGGLGSMEELPIRQRAPLVIAVNLTSDAQVTDTVDHPTGASVQAALSRLVADASDSGYTSGNRIYYDRVETHSVEQATLRLGLSYRYVGTSLDAELGFSASRREHTITAFYKQVMYDAFIVPPQTPAEFFSDEFTAEKLDEQVQLGHVGPGNLPVYVGRMQYGRMMMFTMTSTATAMEMDAAVNASYHGLASYEADVAARYQRILDESRYQVVTVGGSDTTALRLIREGNLREYFASGDPITTAAPLAYTLYNLADGSIATVSETTSYEVTECAEANARCFLNKSEWEAAMEELAPSGATLSLPTTADTLVMADEVNEPPHENLALGQVLTFDSLATGYPFTFLLRAPVSGHNLVFDDRETSSYTPAFRMNQDRSLGIGDVDDAENDDFEIRIPGYRRNTAVFAIGITVADNEAESGEFTAVNGSDGFSREFSDCTPDSPGTPGFLGVLSTVPLNRLFFNEHSAGDDIFVRDFVFGVLEW